MSEGKQVIDELWQELVDAQRAKEQALADKMAAKIEQARREKRARDEEQEKRRARSVASARQ